jgi:AAA domain, putative AbiEii toxin, Type IV TA system
MIQKIVLRRFKRFKEVTIDLRGNVVLAGPNNMGKTTVLQAIAAWSLALSRWKELNDFQRHGQAYTKVPIARQAFAAVPLRSFPLLWNDVAYAGSIEIEVQLDTESVTMELHADSTEQIYARPRRDAPPDRVRQASIDVVFVPPMTGLSVEEPVYQPAYIAHALGRARPGDVLRNLLVAARDSAVWDALVDTVHRLFGYRLEPPDSTGAFIVAGYREREGGPVLDIASAGSGFQQVLMLLTFLYTRPASLLLVDEPDAHLHVLLQDIIFQELQTLAFKQRAQIILATHSEVIIDSVPPELLCVLLDPPRRIKDGGERARLSGSLGIVPQTDLMIAERAPGVLYTEGHTDLSILRAWAGVLGHPAAETLAQVLWKPTVWETRPEGDGIRAKDHYDALCLLGREIPGLKLIDRDDRYRGPDGEITGKGLQLVIWRRYEIESYLVHPAAIERFIEKIVGSGAASEAHRQKALEWFDSTLKTRAPVDFMGTNELIEAYLTTKKASEAVLPRILDAAGLPAFRKTDMHEIAAVMLPEEIHPEVIEKLETIQRAFGLS